MIFIVNHAGRGYLTESLRLLGETIATHPEVDRILRGAGFRMGPFELLDLTGLDVSQPVMESIYDQYYQEPRFRPSRASAKPQDCSVARPNAASTVMTTARNRTSRIRRCRRAATCRSGSTRAMPKPFLLWRSCLKRSAPRWIPACDRAPTRSACYCRWARTSAPPPSSPGSIRRAASGSIRCS